MTAALTWARLSYRQQRWELILVAVGVAAVAVAMLWFSGQLDGLRAASPECLGMPMEQAFPDSGPPIACQSILNDYSARRAWLTTFSCCRSWLPVHRQWTNQP